MDLATLGAGGTIGAIGALVGVLATNYNKVKGEPQDRMAHALAKDAQEHDQAKDREEKLLERITALEQRLDTQASLIAEQGRQQGELQGQNVSLRGRVQALEEQLTQAGLAHVADLATIANLRADLEAAKTLLESRDQRIEELELRVSELEAALEAAISSAKAAKKKAAAKKAKARNAK